MAGRTLAVLGSLVSDVIVRREEFRDWGGVSYTLSGLAAALPDGWQVRPIVRVGEDRFDDAMTFFRSLPLDLDTSAVKRSAGRHPQVRLEYSGETRMAERLLDVPEPWSGPELMGSIDGAGALLVNFITGFETTLGAMRHLREHWTGPVWADLHSLFLERHADGARTPRTLPEAPGWCALFDAIQLNSAESRLLARSAEGEGEGASESAMAGDRAAEDMGGRLLTTVTRGAEGAEARHGPGFEANPLRWPRLRTRQDHLDKPTRREAGSGGPRATVQAHGLEPVPDPDPTGCGDVWGGATFGRLLAGDDLSTAMLEGNRMASRNARHRGTRGLAVALREPIPSPPRSPGP